MSDPRFYENLPVFEEFARLTEPDHYRPVPEDWSVVVADIEGSTAAIAKGQYKQVNIVGAATIAAVLEAVKPLKVPFIFGGDGATLCVPGTAMPAVRQALMAAKLMARESFGLALRVGLIPVGDLHAAGHRVLVARFRVSDQYNQAVFTGGGISCAEVWIKDPDRGRPYRLKVGDVTPTGSFRSIECRWEDIPSPHGETVSLVVRALSPVQPERDATYREVIQEIHRVYGEGEVCRPVRQDVMRLARLDEKLAAEVGVRAFGHGRLYRAGYRLWLKAQMAIGRVVFPRGLTFGGVDWGRYQREVVENTDCRKFDDQLRQVMSGTPRQREELTRFLAQRQARGELVYGLQAAPSALMTCLIFNRHGEHVHFVDGADGGYAAAAARLKQQLQEAGVRGQGSGVSGGAASSPSDRGAGAPSLTPDP